MLCCCVAISGGDELGDSPGAACERGTMTEGATMGWLATAGIDDERRARIRPDLVEVASALDRRRLVRADTEIGPLWLRGDDAVRTPWISHYRSWERDTTALLRASLAPGLRVIDVGANIGYHSLVCAHAVSPGGAVLALEPEPTNYAVLCANLWHARAANVEPIRAAASDRTGSTPRSLSDTNMGDHRTLYGASCRGAIEVACVRIADLVGLDERVDLVKLDIQGSEHVAIRGMERLIARHRPLLVVEFWPLGIRALGDDPVPVFAYYRSLGYAISLLEAPQIDHEADLEAVIVATEALAGGFGTLILRPMDSTPGKFRREVPSSIGDTRGRTNGRLGGANDAVPRMDPPSVGRSARRESRPYRVAQPRWS